VQAGREKKARDFSEKKRNLRKNPSYTKRVPIFLGGTGKGEERAARSPGRNFERGKSQKPGPVQGGGGIVLLGERRKKRSQARAGARKLNQWEVLPSLKKQKKREKEKRMGERKGGKC